MDIPLCKTGTVKHWMKLNNQKNILLIRFGLLLIIYGLFGYRLGVAQQNNDIKIPDVLGYKTLKGDFHVHTVFSDGYVWPSIRTEEASREGLDMIAITDHLESTNLFRFERIFGGAVELDSDNESAFFLDRNLSHEIASESAETRDVFVLRGAEISRTMPPGHHNAIFLTDINKLNTPHPQWREAFLAAKEQEAFIIWNHPASYSYPVRTTLWWEEHSWLLENNMMHGIEVVNGRRYDPVAHQWALEKNLAIIGSTDIHGPVGMSYASQEEEKRTMTLVFSKERTLEGIKEALFSRRTMAFYDNKLIGHRNFLDAIFFHSIVVESVERMDNGFQAVINNPTDISYELSKATENDPSLQFFESINLPAGKQTTLKIYTENPSAFNKIDLNVIVTNLIMAPDEGLPVTLSFILE